MEKDDLILLNKIAQTIFDKKGFNILALDVREISNLADYMILAEGNVDRHVIAIAHAIENDLRDFGERALYIEGMKGGDWVVLDYGAIMVHLFTPGLRDKYRLEDLWKEGKIVDVKIDVEESQALRVNTNE